MATTWEITCDNGEKRSFDVKPYLDHGVFVHPREADAVRDVRAVTGSIDWGMGSISISVTTTAM